MRPRRRARRKRAAPTRGARVPARAQTDDARTRTRTPRTTPRSRETSSARGGPRPLPRRQEGRAPRGATCAPTWWRTQVCNPRRRAAPSRASRCRRLASPAKELRVAGFFAVADGPPSPTAAAGRSCTAAARTASHCRGTAAPAAPVVPAAMAEHASPNCRSRSPSARLPPYGQARKQMPASLAFPPRPRAPRTFGGRLEALAARAARGRALRCAALWLRMAAGSASSVDRGRNKFSQVPRPTRVRGEDGVGAQKRANALQDCAPHKAPRRIDGPHRTPAAAAALRKSRGHE